MKKCPVCGKVLQPYEEHYLDERGECFECSLWRERLPLVGNPDTVIIDGTFYTIGNENSTDPFRGFGGDKFVIRFKDGGKPFNPLEQKKPDTKLSWMQRRIGGLGIYLVTKKMDNVHYAYVDNQNVLTIEKLIKQ